MSFTYTFQEFDVGKTFHLMFSSGYGYNYKAATVYPAIEEEKQISKNFLK